MGSVSLLSEPKVFLGILIVLIGFFIRQQLISSFKNLIQNINSLRKISEVFHSATTITLFLFIVGLFISSFNNHWTQEIGMLLSTGAVVHFLQEVFIKAHLSRELFNMGKFLSTAGYFGLRAISSPQNSEIPEQLTQDVENEIKIGIKKSHIVLIGRNYNLGIVDTYEHLFLERIKQNKKTYFLMLDDNASSIDALAKDRAQWDKQENRSETENIQSHKQKILNKLSTYTGKITDLDKNKNLLNIIRYDRVLRYAFILTDEFIEIQLYRHNNDHSQPKIIFDISKSYSIDFLIPDILELLPDEHPIKTEIKQRFIKDGH